MSGLHRRLGRVIVLSERRAPRPVAPATALEKLLGGRPLNVLYQPILARRLAADGVSRWQIAGVEALVRAGGSRGECLKPQQFLPLIERAGLMPALFKFVLAESLVAVLDWERRSGLALGVAVNLHASALLDDTLPEFLNDLLMAVGVAPQRLTLELTEGAPIADLKQAARNLKRLRECGVRAALDDFGVGFSTTTRLAWLKCDELKIDRALVLGLERCEEQRCVVENLITLAHANGMTACAEGVETPAALRLLGAFDCDRAQGYLVSRPVDAESIVALAKQWGARDEVACESDDPQMQLPGFAFAGALSYAGDMNAVA